MTTPEREAPSRQLATCGPRGSARDPGVTPALEIQDLRVVYDSPASGMLGGTGSAVPAVRGVSIVVAPGELVVIVGE